MRYHALKNRPADNTGSLADSALGYDYGIDYDRKIIGNIAGTVAGSYEKAACKIEIMIKNTSPTVTLHSRGQFIL